MQKVADRTNYTLDQLRRPRRTHRRHEATAPRRGEAKKLPSCSFFNGTQTALAEASSPPLGEPASGEPVDTTRGLT
jgi:hypothetical protein